MAISKERLEELIKEGTTIYILNFVGDLEEYQLGVSDETDYWLFTITGKLFEQKQDGEKAMKELKWALKYHATRTEELDLPMWEEFKNYNENISVSFVGEDWCVYELSIENNEIVLCQDEAIWLRWDLTEKDYIKACDLCLKLFKGEEDGN